MNKPKDFKELPEFLQRMITERDELKEKAVKLEMFITTGQIRLLKSEQITLLSIQLNAMKVYLAALERRIELCSEEE